MLMKYIRIYVLLLSATISSLNSFAQQVKTIEKGIYRFPAFAEGTVILRNGIMSSASLNYDISLDEMHFIAQNGDTLALAEPATIHFISLNGTRFYYDKGYLQVLDTAADLLLAYRQQFSKQQLRPGAYGSTIPHEGARTFNFFNGTGQRYNMGEDYSLTLTPMDYYFFGDQYGHFSKTSKAFILEHFAKYHAAVNSYLQNNHINFNRLADLEKLLAYCSRLGS